MIFPRYNRLDAVRKIVAAARAEGAGHNYLIQYSAGKGKINSTAWLSHRLRDRAGKAGSGPGLMSEGGRRLLFSFLPKIRFARAYNGKVPSIRLRPARRSR